MASMNSAAAVPAQAGGGQEAGRTATRGNRVSSRSQFSERRRLVQSCLLAKHREQQESDARCVSHSDKTSSCLPDATVAALPLQRLPPTDTRVSGPPAFTCLPPSSGFTPNKHSLVAAEIIPGTKRVSRLLLWQFSPPFLSGWCLQSVTMKLQISRSRTGPTKQAESYIWNSAAERRTRKFILQESNSTFIFRLFLPLSNCWFRLND